MEITVPRLEQIKALKDLVAELQRRVKHYEEFHYLNDIQREALRCFDSPPGFVSFLGCISKEERQQLMEDDNMGILSEAFKYVQSENGKYAEVDGHFEWYKPEKHITNRRWDFDEESFRRALLQYRAIGQKVIWDISIKDHIPKIEIALTPWLPYMRNYLNEQEIAEIQESIKAPTTDNLAEVLHQLERIEATLSIAAVGDESEDKQVANGEKATIAKQKYKKWTPEELQDAYDRYMRKNRDYNKKGISKRQEEVYSEVAREIGFTESKNPGEALRRAIERYEKTKAITRGRIF